MANLVEEQKNMTDLMPCNEVYGGTYSQYYFGQSDAEVVVTVAVPPGTKGRNVSVSISTNHLTIRVPSLSEVPILDGDLYKPVKASECTWCIQDQKELVVTLVKTNLAYEEWWPAVVTGVPQIDMKKFVPPPAKLYDLDDEGQAAVARMMHEQAEKRAANKIL